MVEMKPWPEFIQKRIQLFDQLMAAYKAQVAAKERNPIKVKLLPENKELDDAIAWETTPLAIAKVHKKPIFDRLVIAKVNNEVCRQKLNLLLICFKLWDLDRPLQADSQLELLTFDDGMFFN